MAHAHSLYDTDPHFRIDPVTRNIINMSGKVVLVQHDHNSERFTFEIPRYVEEHDMSQCTKAEIHYINGNTTSKNHGLYQIDDLQIDPNDDTYVICSWLISHNVTKLIGTLSFMIRFECLTGEIIDYAWSTNIHSGITVSPGIYNSDDIVEEYADVLEQWKTELETAGITITGVEQTITSTEDSGLNEVTMYFSDDSTGTFFVRNGSRGPQGDAFTYEDLTEEQIAALKGEKGDAFTYEDFTVEQLTALTGPAGSSIQSVIRTSGTGAAGTIDTYTITLTDGSTTTFQVYNGADGKGAGDMVAATYDPQGKATDVFAYVDNVVSGITYTETDPTVPDWAKAETKPSYTYDEVGADKYGSAAVVQANLDDHTTNTVAHVTADEKSKWSGKQDTLTFDSTPTENSTNPVTSGGVYTALQNMDSMIGNISTILDSINGEVV